MTYRITTLNCKTKERNDFGGGYTNEDVNMIVKSKKYHAEQHDGFTSYSKSNSNTMYFVYPE